MSEELLILALFPEDLPSYWTDVAKSYTIIFDPLDLKKHLEKHGCPKFLYIEITRAPAQWNTEVNKLIRWMVQKDVDSGKTWFPKQFQWATNYKPNDLKKQGDRDYLSIVSTHFLNYFGIRNIGTRPQDRS